MPTIQPMPAGTVYLYNGMTFVSTGTAWVQISMGASSDMSMYESRVKATHKCFNVNSKRIADKVVAAVVDNVNDYVFIRQTWMDSSYDYTQMIEYLNMLLDDMVSQKEIVTHDVIGDTRNNSSAAIRRGEITISVRYKQFNCLNTTEIRFDITPG